MMGRFSKSLGSAGAPRSSPSTPFRRSRVVNAYNPAPKFDDITGEDVFSSSRYAKPSPGAGERATTVDSAKENRAPPDEELDPYRKQVEELKADLATMCYKVDNYEQEKEMAALQAENELREARRKAEEDFKGRQTAEADRAKAQRQYEALQNELNELKESSAQEKLALEKKNREFGDEARLAKEQLDELRTAKEESERINGKQNTDLQTIIANLQNTMAELEKEASARDALLQETQNQLCAQNQVVGDLEAEVLMLKAKTGDAETMDVIRRELQEQVQHIRTLEHKTARQHADLVHLRQVHKAVEVVEEEKRSLQRKLHAAEALDAELAEARIQRQRLEDERLAWTAYLQNAGEVNGAMEFDSPEAVARALVQERYNAAALMEKLGEVQPQIAERDEMIKLLETDKHNLSAEVEKLKTAKAPMPVDKALARMERQRLLAVKEAEYLRAQLKALDNEDETFEPEKVDKQQAGRISELEQLVDSYRAEVQALHKELSSVEPPKLNGVPQPVAGTKRPRDQELESEQIGELNRKRRKLADELSKEKTTNQVLKKELSVVKSRLQTAESHNRTRVLSLRSNPTSDFEAVKVATLTALKEENEQLLAQLKNAHPRPAFPVIPASQLDACRREVEEARKETASAHKTSRRLKEVWAAKSQEFKEAIFSTLGWTVTFMPNGKMRVESLFCPSRTDEYENSILFDGERGTMKVSGGPQSAFARRIADQIQFWVRDKGCIPGFLAALTLEFYEEQRGAASSQ